MSVILSSYYYISVILKCEFECDSDLLLLYKCDLILSDCEYECDFEPVL
jgi:hypothetical protein